MFFRLFKIVALCAFALMAVEAVAEKPRWVGNTPKEGNDTYRFVEVVSSGNSLSQARANALTALAQDKQLEHAVEANVESGLITNVETISHDNETHQTIHDTMEVNVSLKGESYKLQASKIDEYVSGEKYGEVQLHTLYMVAVTDKPNFDKTYLSEKYGIAPVLMSIIPGAGQWYKGNKVKGGCIFGAEAIAVAGIIVCENQRASYIKKSKEHPKFAKEYGNKADSWATGRNITIGVAAGIWVYNIIDAAVAKGARRVIVKKSNGSGLAMAPFVSFDGFDPSFGMSLSYSF